MRYFCIPTNNNWIHTFLVFCSIDESFELFESFESIEMGASHFTPCWCTLHTIVQSKAHHFAVCPDGCVWKQQPRRHEPNTRAQAQYNKHHQTKILFWLMTLFNLDKNNILNYWRVSLLSFFSPIAFAQLFFIFVFFFLQFITCTAHPSIWWWDREVWSQPAERECGYSSRANELPQHMPVRYVSTISR